MRAAARDGMGRSSPPSRAPRTDEKQHQSDGRREREAAQKDHDRAAVAAAHAQHLVIAAREKAGQAQTLPEAGQGRAAQIRAGVIAGKDDDRASTEVLSERDRLAGFVAERRLQWQGALEMLLEADAAQRRRWIELRPGRKGLQCEACQQHGPHHGERFRDGGGEADSSTSSCIARSMGMRTIPRSRSTQAYWCSGFSLPWMKACKSSCGALSRAGEAACTPPGFPSGAGISRR